MFSLFNFSSIFSRGSADPICPYMCGRPCSVVPLLLLFQNRRHFVRNERTCLPKFYNFNILRPLRNRSLAIYLVLSCTAEICRNNGFWDRHALSSTISIAVGGQVHKVHETKTPSCLWLCQIFTDWFFTGRLSNEPFVIWLLTTPPHHVLLHATLPCNLSAITCFLTLLFHGVVLQHIQSVLGFFNIRLLHIY